MEKRKRVAFRKPSRSTLPGVHPLKTLSAALEGIEPWFPWAVAGLFLAVMGFFAFRLHTVGGLGVETDFYAELCPPAKELLAGHFSPLNYSAKGPVYSILLAGFSLLTRDFFTAGLLLNIVSASLFLVVLFCLVKIIFNSLTATAVVVITAVNYQFLSYSYQAGSDMPFLLLSAASILFLFRDGGKRDLVLSAVFGLLAFLTRYNGAFVPAGALVYLLVVGEGISDRLRRIGLWFGVFAAVGLPWFIANWIATGSPVKNDNYVNVMMEFYALGKGAAYENWTDALPKHFTGMADIILYDPVYFARHFLSNVAGHFLMDMRDLVGWGIGTFFIIGAVALTMIRPVIGRLLYLTFGVFYFAILSLVFYNPRFSLFLLAVYLPFGVWPLTLPIRPEFLRWGSRLLFAAVLFITALQVPGSVKKVAGEIQASPVFLRDLGTALGGIEPDKTQSVIARKPHTAYYAGLHPLMFPDSPRTIDDLVSYCRDHHIRYILYSVIEARFRPQFAELARADVAHAGLTLVHRSEYGFIYRVEGAGAGAVAP